MADPEPLVDQRDQRLHFGAAALGNLEVEGAGQMQRLDVDHPGIGQLIFGPAAGHQNGDLVVAGAFERPVIAGRQALDHVERIEAMVVAVDRKGHDVSALPKGASGKRTAPHMVGRTARTEHELQDDAEDTGRLDGEHESRGDSDYNLLDSARQRHHRGLMSSDLGVLRQPALSMTLHSQCCVKLNLLGITSEPRRGRAGIAAFSRTGSTPTLHARCARPLRRSAKRSAARGYCRRRALRRSAESSR